MPSGPPPGPGSIIVGNCTACSGLVRVSSTTNANASVRCPHCQQTFPLVKLLESAVPEVEIVQAQPQTGLDEKPNLYIDQTAATEKDASGKFVVPSQLSKGARRRKSSRSKSGRSRSSSRSSESGSSSRRRSHESHSRSDGGSSDSNNKPAQAAASEPVSRDRRDMSGNRRASRSDTSPVANQRNNERDEAVERSQGSAGHSSRSAGRNEESVGPHRSTRHRDTRAAEELNPKPSPVAGILKVLVGASLALPIAYLIVMWVFTRDPLGISGGLSTRIPFLVPAALRASDDSESETPDAVDEGFKKIGSEELSNPIDSSFDGLNIGQEALKSFDQ